MMYKISETEERCTNCVHFHQHYVRGEYFDGGLAPVNIGHCDYPRTKYREPWATCKYFEQRNFVEGDLIRNIRSMEEEANV